MAKTKNNLEFGEKEEGEDDETNEDKEDSDDGFDGRDRDEDEEDQHDMDELKGTPTTGATIDSIDATLQGLEREKLLGLIQALLKSDSKNRKAMLEWMSVNIPGDGHKNQPSVDDHLLSEYWDELENLASDLEYSSRDGEEIGFEIEAGLGKIEKLIGTGTISSGARMGLLEDLTTTGELIDYGFEDEITPILFKACKNQEEWQHLVELLKDCDSSWGSGLIARIYKDYLHDDEAYLKTRRASLKTEADYFDLARYHAGKNDVSQANAIAEKGLLSVEGSVSTLFNFLFDGYKKEGRTADLLRITETVLERKRADTKMLEQAFHVFPRSR